MFVPKKPKNGGYVVSPIQSKKDDGLGVMGWIIGIFAIICFFQMAREEMSKPETDPELRYLTEADREAVLRERAEAASN